MKSSFSIIPIVFCKKKKFKKKLLISLFKLQKPLLVFSGMALQNGRTSLEKNNLIVPAENLKTLSHVSKYEDIPAGHTLCWRSNFDVILSSTAEIYLSMLPCWRVMRQQVGKVLQGNISVCVCWVQSCSMNNTKEQKAPASKPENTLWKAITKVEASETDKNPPGALGLSVSGYGQTPGLNA